MRPKPIYPSNLKFQTIYQEFKSRVNDGNNATTSKVSNATTSKDSKVSNISVSNVESQSKNNISVSNVESQDSIFSKLLMV